MKSPDRTQQILQNPDWIDQELAERGLWEFIRQMWRYVDPAPFKDNWHIGAVCEHLEAVTRGEIRRLIINIPPRHMKSISVCVGWPAWTWIQNPVSPLSGPQTSFLFTSYAQALSTRDSVKCRRLIDSAPFQRRWGERFRLLGDQNTKTRFDNNHNGYRLATSVDGLLTGEGASIICVDDAHSVREKESETVRQSVLDWWDESMSTRLNDPATGAYVIIMQRVHHQDLVGHLLEKGGWEHLCLPARYESDHPHLSIHDLRTIDGELLWPSRFPEQAIHELEINLGSYGSAGQLQQRPSPRSGGMFDRSWWKIVDAAPAKGRSVRGWDLAGTEEAAGQQSRAAYSAGCKMKRVDGIYYIENMIRFRGSPSDVERTIKNTAALDGTKTVIDLPQDPGQAGKAQVQYLVRQLSGYTARYSPESGAKEVRAEALSAQAEAGNVCLVRGSWNTTFIDEAAFFPNSDYSDQVDAASRAFHRIARRRKHDAMHAKAELFHLS